MLLGMIQLELGQIDNGIATLERTLADTDDPARKKQIGFRERIVLFIANFYLDRGTLMRESGNPSEAIKDLNTAYNYVAQLLESVFEQPGFAEQTAGYQRQ